MASSKDFELAKGAYLDFDIAFIDKIFDEYFKWDNGLFTIHDKSQQKVPAINIYKEKLYKDGYCEEAVFIVDIALGLYSKEDFLIEVTEDHGRQFLSISVNKKDLPEDYIPIVKQISTNCGRRVIEFKNKIENVEVMDTKDIPGIIRLRVTTRDANVKLRVIEL